MLGELDLKYKVIILIAVIIGAVAGYYFFFGQSTGSISASASSGDSSTSMSARPYVDYKTADGKILRVYLDDGSKYWVNPDGSLTPYTPQTWTVPGTLSAITQARFGFDITLNGKYLKDLDADGNQDIDVVVDATIQAEQPTASGSYTVFSNYKVNYDVGSPSTGGTGTYNIQSNFISIDTIYSSVWGGTPAQDTDYKPQYVVTVTVNATSYWGEPISTSASNTYGSTVIGYWNWKQAELSVSLGSASSSTQSLVGVISDNSIFIVVMAIGVIMAVLVFAGHRD